MSIHAESLALAEEYCVWHVQHNGNSPGTAKRYRDELIGADRQRPGHQAMPLIKWWAEEAPSKPIWSIRNDDLKRWYAYPVRARGHGSKPPSPSILRLRQAAAIGFVKWLATNHNKKVDVHILTYKAPHWEKLARSHQASLPSPFDDLTFRGLWHAASTTDDDRLWIGQMAFMTMRATEACNVRPFDFRLEDREAFFIRKGNEYAWVHYGELIDQTWPRLKHLGDEFAHWEELLIKRVEQRQADCTADPGDMFLFTHSGYPDGAPDEDEMEPGWWEARPMDQWRPKKSAPLYFNRRLERLLIDAGVDPVPYNPHRLRATAGTNMYRAGVSRERIMAEMNHGSFETTLIYIGLNTAFDNERERNMHKTRAEQLRDY